MRWLWVGLVLFSLVAGCRTWPAPAPAPATVVFLTDFGTSDDMVAICKGIMWQIDPTLRIVDLSHAVPPYNIEMAARLLAAATPFYPAGTVFVAVVDPAVGTEQKGLAIRTGAGHLLVGPDNGIFTLVLQKEGLKEARALVNGRYFRKAKDVKGRRYRARDVFTPVGAHLARGTKLRLLGPEVKTPVKLPLKQPRLSGGELVGQVSYIDAPYGNVVTNIPAKLLSEMKIDFGDRVEVTLEGKKHVLPFRRTFGDVPKGAPLAYPSRRGLLCFAVNMGDFAATFHVKAHQEIRIRKLPGTAD